MMFALQLSQAGAISNFSYKEKTMGAVEPKTLDKTYFGIRDIETKRRWNEVAEERTLARLLHLPPPLERSTVLKSSFQDTPGSVQKRRTLSCLSRGMVWEAIMSKT